jgi:hypothetical protein
MIDEEYTWLIVDTDEDAKRLAGIVEGFEKNDKIYTLSLNVKSFLKYCKRIDKVYFYIGNIGGEIEDIEFRNLTSGEEDVISQYSAKRMVDLFNHLKEYGKISTYTNVYFSYAKDSVLLIKIFDKTAVIAPMVSD